MAIHRHMGYGCSAALLPLSLMTGIACAADPYPVKPIRWIVPTSAGSGADTVGRIVTNGLAQVTGQTVVVENRAGAAGNIAAEFVAKAPKDGYTVLQANFSHGVNMSLYKKLGYDLLRDFAAVTNLGASPALLVVHPSLPVKNAKQLVALAKARPGAINYASAGAGSPTFIGGELFRFITGANMLHVPYRGGGEAINAMVSGETSVYFAPLASALPHVKTGKLRALGVSSKERAFFAQDVPPIADVIPGFNVQPWHGMMAPAGTPQAIVNKLSEEIQAFLRTPDAEAKLRAAGVVRIGSSARDFAQAMDEEFETYKKVVKDAGIKPD